jgi:hypothetical protein
MSRAASVELAMLGFAAVLVTAALVLVEAESDQGCRGS